MSDLKKFLDKIDELPENQPLYRDSGLWQIRTDDMEDVLFQQGVNESFKDFIERYHEEDNIWHYISEGDI